MVAKRQTLISAQVILKPAGRKAAAPITSSNVGETLPSADALDRARKAFGDAGFEVGTAVANSFSITAPARTFDKVFGTRLHRAPGAQASRSSRHAASDELPLDKLPKRVATLIDAVTMTPPPDFGPTSY